MKILLGLMLATSIGILCRLAGIPVPAPPAVVGALLVLSMTLGYLAADRWLARRPVPAIEEA
jgi:XapX domain-containing protein